jgi:hypothetical protein
MSKPNLEILLATANSMRESQASAKAFMGRSQEQKTKLEQEKFTLQQKLVDIETAASTYDREFHDRRENGPAPKANTVQDWVLKLFFMSYGLLIFGFLYYLIFRANMSILAFSMLMALLLGISVGLVTIIQQYA